MILMIALGLLMSLLGVALGCTVLELTVRALGHSLPGKRRRTLLGPRAGSRLHATNV